MVKAFAEENNIIFYGTSDKTDVGINNFIQYYELLNI